MELKKCLNFRNLWLGIAMLWIVFFHGSLEIDSQGLLLLKNFGYGGVDICLFASGIGCYFSLEKDADILRFLSRRVKRLGPTYLCFIIPWLLWEYWISPMPFQAILGNLLGVQTLASWDYHFNWYIGGLVLYYFARPYLKRLTDSCKTIWQDAAAWLSLAVLTVSFWDSGSAIVILSRLPVLYSGMVFGKLAKQGYGLKRRDYLVLSAAALAGVCGLLIFYFRFPDQLWNWGLYWYPFALIVPGSCVLFSVLAEKMEKYKVLRWGKKILEIVGIYSFELYLVHVFLYEGVMPQIRGYLWKYTVNKQWVMSIPVIILGTFLLNRVASLANCLISKQKA